MMTLDTLLGAAPARVNVPRGVRPGFMSVAVLMLPVSTRRRVSEAGRVSGLTPCVLCVPLRRVGVGILYGHRADPLRAASGKSQSPVAGRSRNSDGGRRVAGSRGDPTAGALQSGRRPHVGDVTEM